MIASRRLRLGVHLEMPGSGDYNRKKIVAAKESGALQSSQLDQMVTELMAAILLARASRRPAQTAELEQHHLLARKAAGESIVLLKNKDQILPLNLEKISRISITGLFRKKPLSRGRQLPG